MGKRKSRKIEKRGPPLKLPTTFDCPYCGRGSAIEVKLDKKNLIGILRCINLECEVSENAWQTRITCLDHPVDVYHMWIDACHGVQKEEGEGEDKKEDEDES
eukprot:Filipodium_phascolosomae@DN2455_c0_g1_i2.p1